MRVLGKPELSNAIKLVDLETLMSNFGPPSPREEDQQQVDPNAPNQQQMQEDVSEGQEIKKQAKPNKRKQQIS